MLVDEITKRPILTDSDIERRNVYLSGLREFIAWYEARPNMPAPYGSTEALFASSCWTPQETAALIREAGSVDKIGEKTSDYSHVVKRFPGDCQWRMIIDKEKTCRRVKVSDRVIEAVPERIIPAEPERVEEVFEWKCDEPLLASLTNGKVRAEHPSAVDAEQLENA